MVQLQTIIMLQWEKLYFPYITTQMGPRYTSNVYVLQDALLLGGYLQQKTQKFLAKTVTAHGRNCKKSRKRIAYLKAVISTELQFVGKGLDVVMPCCAQPGTALSYVLFLRYTVKKATQTVWWVCKGYILHWLLPHKHIRVRYYIIGQTLLMTSSYISSWHCFWIMIVTKSLKGLWKRYASSAVSEHPKAAQHAESIYLFDYTSN